MSMLRTMVKHIQHNIQNFMRNNIKKHMLVSMKKYGQRIMLVHMLLNILNSLLELTRQTTYNSIQEYMLRLGSTNGQEYI